MMKLESVKHVVCEGNCKECVRCLRLYLCDAEDCGGMSVWRTWLDNCLALSSAWRSQADESKFFSPVCVLLFSHRLSGF